MADAENIGPTEAATSFFANISFADFGASLSLGGISISFGGGDGGGAMPSEP